MRLKYLMCFEEFVKEKERPVKTRPKLHKANPDKTKKSYIPEPGITYILNPEEQKKNE